MKNAWNHNMVRIWYTTDAAATATPNYLPTVIVTIVSIISIITVVTTAPIICPSRLREIIVSAASQMRRHVTSRTTWWVWDTKVTGTFALIQVQTSNLNDKKRETTGENASMLLDKWYNFQTISSGIMAICTKRTHTVDDPDIQRIHLHWNHNN